MLIPPIGVHFSYRTWYQSPPIADHAATHLKVECCCALPIAEQAEHTQPIRNHFGGIHKQASNITHCYTAFRMDRTGEPTNRRTKYYRALEMDMKQWIQNKKYVFVCRWIPVPTWSPRPRTGSTGSASPCLRRGSTRLSATSRRMRTGSKTTLQLTRKNVNPISKCKTASAARNWIHSFPQIAATTFALPSVLNLRFFYGCTLYSTATS